MEKFDDIRPYYDSEISEAMHRIADNATFPLLASYVYPDDDLNTVRQRVRSYDNIRDFQHTVMMEVNRQVIRRSITELTFGGLEHLSPSGSYMYVSNHRDIMLDSSLMQYLLVSNGFETTEITFGANLMQGQLVVDIGKSNRMFRVERPGTNVREFYRASCHLSEYMRKVITDDRHSVWIAQRNGRTKDGIDRTDQGIIKMFGMSYSGDKVEALAQLHLVPVSVSYEWESCDILKTLELYERRRGPYTKKPGEDLNSILTGIVQPKGRVHMEFCRPISRDELTQWESCTSGDFHRHVATLLDERICTAYRLTPNNYIAHDLLYGNEAYSHEYTEEQKQAFLHRMRRLCQYEESSDVETLFEIFLGIYANPIESKMLFTSNPLTSHL
ncbi:MAG: acyltransferase [Bacteroidaceae bacterium]|nr:acyltransferase [Bacteroidaceae bacterium]